MPKFATPVILLMGFAIDIHAQGMGAMPMPSAAQISEARALCDSLATMPNAPMSVEACRAMTGMAAQLQASGGDPTASRPGDDAMTCDAIFAQLRNEAGAGIADVDGARAQALVLEGTAMADRQAGELAGFMVETQAVGAAAGVVGAFTPNFVGAAIAAAWQAHAIGFAAKQSAEAAPLRAQANQAVAASMDELNRSMMSNPRFLRLGQLATARNCQPPAQAAR